jgi:hypothetical protein
MYEPGHTALLKACQEFTPKKVLWAIELALSPEKANGKPKTWGYVLGILQRDKEGSYQVQKYGASKNGTKEQYAKTKRTDDIPTGFTADEWQRIITDLGGA